jgi:hypothetical protein
LRMPIGVPAPIGIRNQHNFLLKMYQFKIYTKV